MKKFALIFCIFFVSFIAIFAQNIQQTYLDYIDQYADLAVEQQEKYKIPASITLAQGLLESLAGRSELACSSNNHFGIKCSNWAGERVFKMDDNIDPDCFRKYKSVRDSYIDHSLFLTSRPRYASLFSLETTNYRAWARGLKAAGYATDPNYPTKLIKLIEDYELYKFDKKYKPNKPKKHNSRTILKGHELFRNNGVKCVFAEAGDSYESIANEFGIKQAKILLFNDLSDVKVLEPGSIVYLSKKKNKASREFYTHQVKVGESMYFIAQKYAMKLQKLYDLNKLPYSQGAVEDMILKLK